LLDFSAAKGTIMGRTTAALDTENSRETSKSSESTILAGVVSVLGLTADEAEAMYAHARARDAMLVAAAGSSAPPTGFAETAAIAHIVARLAAERRLGRRRVDRLTVRLAKAAELPADLVRLVLYLEALREPQLLELPPDQAIEAQLMMLTSFAPVTEVSLWSAQLNGRLRCDLHLGHGVPSRRVRSAAGDVLRDSVPTQSTGALIHAIPVLRNGQPLAALVLRARLGERERALVFADEAALTLPTALERQALLARSAEDERSLVESGERRLARLGLDLHDGAIQELAAFAGDLALLRKQLSGALATHEHGDILIGRIGDLEARLVELDRELRELARSAESSALIAKPFGELIAEQVEVFSARHDVETDLAVRGHFDSLTASQRIALLRVVQEALTNVREHSGASRVSVTVFPSRTHVFAEITDNGCGFEVERTLVQAAKGGHLGLVGMSERIRLLGGRFDIQSRRGGPTTISATVPKWRPAHQDAQPAALFSAGQVQIEIAN
jgi:signal transduction histidine kinase